jgi:probable F420-dependent oxidoreductase
MTVEIGMCSNGAQDVVGRAQRLEQLGYDYLAVGEHISFNMPAASPLIALAAAAAVTTRLKLITSVVLAPLYPAALLATMTATLDHISGGRLHLGVGVGGEYPDEIEACGVPMTQRGARADDTIDIVRRLWTEDRVDHVGRFATLRAITIDPKPARKPHPPIWVSGRKDAALRRAARVGDGWLPYLFTPEMIRSALHRLGPMCEENGRDPATIRSGAVIFVSCHENAATARELALERLNTQYAQDFAPMLERYVAHGTPETVRARLDDYIDAGVETILLAPACPDKDTVELEHLLAETVLPRYRPALSARSVGRRDA